MLVKTIFVLYLLQCAYCQSLLKYLFEFRNNVRKEDVKFYLFTKENSGVLLNDLPSNSIDTTKETVFITHGYTHNMDLPYFKVITDAFLKKGDFNVIHVDWRKPAMLLYSTSSKKTKPVGEILAHFIIDHNLDLNKVHISGHSLGSHVAGFAGKKIQELTGKKVRRITGLDPAGPYFENEEITPKDRLSPDDAKNVVAIHTNYKFLGYKNPLGKLDIYFNGGAEQPYCLKHKYKDIGLARSTICDHMSVLDYFAEFINKNIHCKMCPSLDDCSITENRDLSFDNVEKTRGICFVETGPDPPFL